MKFRHLLQVFGLLLTLFPAVNGHGQVEFKCLQNLTIAIDGGGMEAYNCTDDGLPNVIKFKPSSYATPIYFLVTDENNIIIKVNNEPRINFEDLGAGQFRVWALSFLGEFFGEPGQDATTAELASICYELSDNFVPVYNVTPEGGSVSTTEGETVVYTCTGDGTPDVIRFATTSTDPLYAYAVTDSNDQIITIVKDGNSYDFEGSEVGTCHVWGFSYVGNIIAQPGEKITETILADGCFDLSGNFVTVIKTIPDGGTVALTEGGTEVVACLNAEDPDIFTFSTTTTSQAPYLFLVTDENNIILVFLEGNELDVSSLDASVCHIWGLSYTGSITAQPGDNAAEVALSDDCYDLSDNFVTITKKDPQGGQVALNGGATDTTVCVADGQPDLLVFNTDATDNESYTFLITDENNIILDFAEGGSFDFEGSPAGICRVWGLAFTGNLTAMIGDNAAEIALSDECFELSANFITINRVALDAGQVNITGGATDTTLCLGDANGKLLFIVNNSTSGGNYHYLITDENNIILGISMDGVVDFSPADPGICRIWGLNFSGRLTAKVGDNAAEVALSDECYDLSDNFVTVTRKDMAGGTVLIDGGATDTTLCVADGQPDLLVFEAMEIAGEDYAFLITDENNIILDFAEGGAFDFEGSPAGVCRVWGLAFTGNFTAMIGDNAAEAALSDECYLLSNNFITVNRIALDAGMVTTDDGATSTTVCFGPAGDLTLTFVNNSTSGGSYHYLVTDEDNIIIAISQDGQVDYGSILPDTTRIWGANFTGNFTAMIGDNAAEIALSDECYDLSDNFVLVARKAIDGGDVSITGGATDTTLCVADGQPDLLTFTTTAVANESYTYLITDEDNVILGFAPDGSFDFESSDSGILRVWGLAFTGNLTAMIGDNAAEVALSDECYLLSNNFITVNRIALDASMITTDDGATSTTVCFGSAGDLTLTFVNNSTSGGSYYYLVTDEDNIIIAISQDGQVDYGSILPDTTRIWGANFTGNFTAMIGDNAAEIALSDECYDLSDNFVLVVRKAIDGGDVSITGGATDTTLCVADGQPDLLTFTTTAVANESYTYLITNEDNIILGFAPDGSFDFESSDSGILRVWGLAFTGNLTAMIGDNAAEVALSDECFLLSNNFITVNRIAVVGGNISLPGGETEALICLGDMEQNTLLPVSDTDFTGSYVFLVTDTNNVVLRIEEGPGITFSGTESGIDLIWGLAYTGNLTVMIGDNAAEVALSDECYSLSGNSIRVTKKFVDGGTVSLTDGSTEAFACTGDGEPDELTFTSATTSTAPYAYIITDTNDIIIVILQGNSLDFDIAPAGFCRAWGLSYTGNLTPFIGVSIDSVALSDECYELSENFVLIRKEAVDGGVVSTIEGQDTVNACPGDGRPDIVQMENTGSSTGAYVYVITDTANVIEAITDQSIIDFEDAGAGISRIWGLAYTGNLIARPGDNAAEIPLSDECFNLSGNFITVIREVPDGGTVATATAAVGDTIIYVCPGDDQPDIIRFTTTSTFEGAYAYLVTDTANLILAVVETDSFDFNNSPVGTCRVWGLAYRGNLTAMVGDDVTTDPLADECFGLSTNFIAVNRVVPEGGTVATADGETEINICPGDGNPDIVRFASEGSFGNYAYLVTDEANIILAVVETDSFDFDSAPPGVCLVWGLAYTGNLTAQPGDNAGDAALSDDCFDLSQNSITVIRAVPSAGTVSTSEGETEVALCSGDGQSDLINFKAEGTSRTPYLFLLTDEQDTLIQVIETGIDFDTLTVSGNLRVYGLAYTGNPTLSPGMVVTEEALSDDCYDLSGDFIRIDRSLVDGGRISSSLGEGRISVCAGDGNPDFVRFFNNSTATDAEYRYVITTENNFVLSIMVDDDQNFENTGFKILRTWGISYTGNLELQPGQIITEVPISDGCYALSENFITVIQDMPKAGTVSTTEGETTVEICIGLREPVLTMRNTSTSLSNYVYLLTDEANVIAEVVSTDTIDFTELPNGNYRIWGLSYTGLVNVGPGDDIDGGDLATSCYELTASFVRVSKGGPVDGGSIQSAGGQVSIEGCAQNEVPDLVILETTSTSPSTNYRYVITDTDNKIIIPDIEGFIIDFDGADPGVYLIWGVSFTGEFQAAFGMDVLEDELSSECSQPSANPVTVTMYGPLAGEIATDSGVTTAFTPAGCGGEVADPVGFVNTGTPSDGSKYAYLITRLDTVVAVIEDGQTFSFGDLFCDFTYQVIGMAYFGDLPNLIGLDVIQDILFGDLLSGCVNLSENRINVNPNPGIQETPPSSEGIRAEWPGTGRALSSLAVTPNPARDLLHLSFELHGLVEATSQIEIFNTVGQLVQYQLIPVAEGRNLQRIDISRLHPGIYTLHLRSGKQRQSVRFVKN